MRFAQALPLGLARGLIAADPTAGLSRPHAGGKPRERVLSDAELALVWKASESLDYPFEGVVKMLILTGQRRSEISDGRWSEIDASAKLWRLPSERVKNKRGHEVPLSPQALALFEALPRIGGSPLLFTTNGKTPVSGFSRTKHNLDAAIAELNGAPIPPFVIHDIRRSVASGMAAIGVDLVVIERVLNHVSGSFAGIVSVYQHHKFEPEMRRALERWGAHIERLVAGEPENNVLPLRRRDGEA